MVCKLSFNYYISKLENLISNYVHILMIWYLNMSIVKLRLVIFCKNDNMQVIKQRYQIMITNRSELSKESFFLW